VRTGKEVEEDEGYAEVEKKGRGKGGYISLQLTNPELTDMMLIVV